MRKKYGLIFIPLFIFCVSSCTVSPQNRVRLGDSPEYQDKDVAFRTTYYFRVFDYCQSNQTSLKIPKSEALYRFKMTGKADTLFSIIKFESGSLKSSQIDPLGTQVIYDKKLGRHRFVSEEENKAEVELKQSLELIDRLEALKTKQASYNSKIDEFIGKLIESIGRQVGVATSPSSNESVTLKIENQFENLKTEVSSISGALEFLGQLKEADLSEPEEQNGIKEKLTAQKKLLEKHNVKSLKSSSDTVDSAITELKNAISDFNESVKASANKTTKNNLGISSTHGKQLIECPPGATKQKGFQVMGPEGWRTFDQDERLILAMTTSSKPLISTMKELSNRVLESQPDTNAELVPLLKEQLKVHQSERVITSKSIGGAENITDTYKPENLAMDICRALVGEESSELCLEDNEVGK